MKDVQGHVLERNQEVFFHKDNYSRKPYIPFSLVAISARKPFPDVNQSAAVSHQSCITTDGSYGRATHIKVSSGGAGAEQSLCYSHDTPFSSISARPSASDSSYLGLKLHQPIKTAFSRFSSFQQLTKVEQEQREEQQRKKKGGEKRLRVALKGFF